MSALFSPWLVNAGIAYRRHQATETFRRLSDSQLRDIGLERSAIEEHVRASLPWQSVARQSQAMLRPAVHGCG